VAFRSLLRVWKGYTLFIKDSLVVHEIEKEFRHNFLHADWVPLRIEWTAMRLIGPAKQNAKQLVTSVTHLLVNKSELYSNARANRAGDNFENVPIRQPIMPEVERLRRQQPL
jgi:hypothetical protein